MLKEVVFLTFALTAGVSVFAADNASRPVIDLRVAAALAQLKETNPAHFEKIQQILTGLEEEPQRAEGDWLQVHFNASDVDLSRYLLKTSNPPRQLLQFTLDDVRYKMHLTRADLTATFVPAE